MPDKLVCPNCGNAEFEQERHCTATATVTAHTWGLDEQTIEITDSGERDCEIMSCTDCWERYDADCSELVTEQEYNDSDRSELRSLFT